MITVSYCREHSPDKIVLSAAVVGQLVRSINHFIHDELDVLIATHTDIGTVDIDETSTDLQYLEDNYQSDFV